jgi:hypothetical protein
MMVDGTREGEAAAASLSSRSIPATIRRGVEWRDWTTMLGWLALTFAALGLVSAFVIEFPIAAVVGSALFVVGWFLLARVVLAGVILIGSLCLIELAGLQYYERKDAKDWVTQGFVLVLGIAGLCTGVGALREWMDSG